MTFARPPPIRNRIGKRPRCAPALAGPERGPFRPERQLRRAVRKAPGVAHKARSSDFGAF